MEPIWDEMIRRFHYLGFGKMVGVFIGYSGAKGYGLLDRRLYMPEKWFGDEYAEKREKCAVPEDLLFKTKNELASEMITKAIEAGLKAKWVGCDGAFGHDIKFLKSIPKGMYYFADVYSTDMFFVEMPEVHEPEYKGRGRKPTKKIYLCSPLPQKNL
jgi:SRSO17 transposase